ncbi:hypothetical protein [Gordonia sp. SMJS1]|uniref:hypothetical protein n=1 Tax=Gordonia sp. SMJS1 TaxID=3039400 RepID=UPI0024564590|nr:hypothetical protein [Gordonia sp. SMJS1]WGJ88296.1 hypothetical protein QAD21_25275 [Gordonia sp. SMJS1]
MTTMEVSHGHNGHAAEQVWPSIGEGVLHLPNPITDAGAWVPAEDVRRVEAEVERLREELRRAELDRDTAREEASTSRGKTGHAMRRRASGPTRTICAASSSSSAINSAGRAASTISRSPSR